jgi:hypothetical protein
MRTMGEIGREIRNDWTKIQKPITSHDANGVDRGHPAGAYVDAMLDMGTKSITDDYFADSGRDTVARFLGNANSWRGDTARRVKAELKQMLADIE